MKKIFMFLFTLSILVCTVILVLQIYSIPIKRYNALNLASKNSSPQITPNRINSKQENTVKSTVSTAVPQSESEAIQSTAPSSSISYSEKASDNKPPLKSYSTESPNTKNNPQPSPQVKYNKNTPEPSRPMRITVTPQQIIDAITPFIISTGIFNDIETRLIDPYTAESTGTITKDIKGLINRYPELNNYRAYLNIASGKNVYAKVKITTNERKQLTPYFESLYIGNLPIPTSFINAGLKEKSAEFTSIVISNLR